MVRPRSLRLCSSDDADCSVLSSRKCESPANGFPASPDNGSDLFATKLRTSLLFRDYGVDTLTTSIAFSLVSKARHLWSVESDVGSIIVIELKRRANCDWDVSVSVRDGPINHMKRD